MFHHFMFYLNMTYYNMTLLLSLHLIIYSPYLREQFHYYHQGIINLTSPMSATAMQLDPRVFRESTRVYWVLTYLAQLVSFILAISDKYINSLDPLWELTAFIRKASNQYSDETEDKHTWLNVWLHIMTWNICTYVANSEECSLGRCNNG